MKFRTYPIAALCTAILATAPLAAGATVGDGAGAEFFFEGIWRQASAEVEVDPEDLGDIDDIDVDNSPSFDIDGFGVNVGVRWAF